MDHVFDTSKLNGVASTNAQHHAFMGYRAKGAPYWVGKYCDKCNCYLRPMKTTRFIVDLGAHFSLMKSDQPNPKFQRHGFLGGTCGTDVVRSWHLLSTAIRC